MSGNRIIKKTTRTLFKTIIWLIMFLIVGIGSYKLTIYYYKSTGQYAPVTGDGVKSIVKATTDTTAVNAIFAVDGDNGRIKHLLLEIFHSQTGKIDFITIPPDSLHGMSKELYSTLSKENPNVPQIIAWEELPQYFSQVTAYQYGSMILEESLGIPVSFYTLMSDTTFNEYFEEKNISTIEGGSATVGYNLKESVRDHIKSLNSSLQMEKELTTYYTKIQSNLSLSRRTTYLSAYQKADYDNIGVYAISKDAYTNQTTDKEWILELIKE